MGRWVAGLAFALLVAAAGGGSSAAFAEQICNPPVANAANPACGDANRGKILYGQVPAPGISPWNCNQCHGNSPLDGGDVRKVGDPPVPILMLASPRNPAYMLPQMEQLSNPANPIGFAMESCCIADRPPNNVMGDLGDIAEFLYTCKMGIAPCVTPGAAATL